MRGPTPGPLIWKDPSIFSHYLQRTSTTFLPRRSLTERHRRKQTGNEGHGFFFFCLYFHLYVNPSPDLGWGLRDSSVRLVNAFARTYSDDGEKLIRPCSPEAIYHFRGVAVCRCVRAPEPFQFFCKSAF